MVSFHNGGIGKMLILLYNWLVLKGEEVVFSLFFLIVFKASKFWNKLANKLAKLVEFTPDEPKKFQKIPNFFVGK
jgi:hypothetical protein